MVIKKISFVILLIFSSYSLIANECKDSVCIEFGGEMLSIPEGYSININTAINQGNIIFDKLDFVKGVEQLTSKISIKSIDKCGLLCERAFVEDEYFIEPTIYTNNEFIAKIWCINDKRKSSPGIDKITVIFDKKNVIIILKDYQFSNLLIDKLGLKKSNKRGSDI